MSIVVDVNFFYAHTKNEIDLMNTWLQLCCRRQRWQWWQWVTGLHVLNHYYCNCYKSDCCIYDAVSHPVFRRLTMEMTNTNEFCCMRTDIFYHIYSIEMYKMCHRWQSHVPDIYRELTFTHSRICETIFPLMIIQLAYDAPVNFCLSISNHTYTFIHQP